MVRLALEQLLDPRVLPVREAELAVEWLFRDRAQEASLAAAPDGPRLRRLSGVRWRLAPRDGTSHRDAPAAITVTKP